MTEDEASPPGLAEVIEAYEEASDRPITGGRWEVLTDDSVQFVRPSGEVVKPAVVPATTLRSSPTWRRVQ